MESLRTRNLHFGPFIVFAIAVSLVCVAAQPLAAQALEPVFVNEIHYDNAGGDTGEAIELAGPAGTDLAGWSLVLYNGSTGATYNTTALAGFLHDEGSGYGTLSFAISGIQNGAPDGIALIDSLGAVVQFLSYEGSFIAANGPAMGQTSVDIGVSESSGTAVGESLQLSGAGTIASDFSWSAASADSFGAVNSGQTFVAAAIELVINEIMPDPSAVSDANGEWFELFNPNASVVDIDGWSFEDLGSNSHTIINGGPLLIAANGYLVLGNNDDSLTNGGVSVDYEYSSFTLAIGDDEVILLAALGFESDRVEYDGGPSFPDPTGASMALADTALDNNVGANWCTASTVYGAGDLGTPGAANDCGVPAVPDLVINEIMPDPSSVSDANGEWFELFNPTASAVDIDGFTIADNGSDSHTITSGGPLLIAAGGYLVLGNNDDSLTNGGVSVDYEYSSFTLGNSDDEVVLLDTLLREVDRMEYDGGPSFPDPTGASMALIDSALDNNVGASWCTSSTLYGDGDLGTPGAANDCVVDVPVLVINEIIQNPNAVFDSNGEWLELFNPGTDPVNIDGFTLRDDGTNSHVINNGGPLVIAAGGFLVLGRDETLADNGGVVVNYQYSDFFLGNGDDEVILLDTALNEVDRVEYDNGSTFPDPTGASMALSSPVGDNNVGANWCTSSTPFGAGDLGTPGAVNDCGGTPEIYDLQGNGAFSPFEDLVVITRGNVVTGVSSGGFFIQTPVARDDFDATTSNGIFVFTGGAPGVAEGDLVDIVGTVVEFFSFTEFDNDGLTVTTTLTGQPLPAPVLLGASDPDPGPFDPPDMERFEGMLVELVDGIATGPTDGFGDTAVTVGAARTFREPGIEFPSPFVGPPVWDANQEVIEVDPDGLGLADENIFATQSVSAIGPVSFSFGDYQILPKALTLGPDPAILQPVREREAGEFTVGSFNLFRLNGGFVKLSAYVIDVLRSPDILAVQEVQDIVELQDLADQIALDDPTVIYTPSLIEGNDLGGIDVGFLTRQNIQIDSLTQVDPNLTFVNPVTFEDNILHDRPPLLLEGSCQLEFGSFPIAVMAVHNRSLGGIDGSQGLRVRKKRFLQAVSIAEKVEALQTADPGIRLVVTGDFNAFEFTDGFVDAVGLITGEFTPGDNLVCASEDCTDLPDNDLVNLTLVQPAEARYSFVFGGNAQVLDHGLTSMGLAAEVTGAEYGRGNADAYSDLLFDDVTAGNIPLRSSDHDGLVVFIAKDEDADGVPNDDDVCAGTVIPESVPTDSLGVNRWALTDGDGAFDTTLPNGEGPGLSFTVGDTAGCSCEQIIEAQGLGNGHTKHGCSNSAMLDWVALVNP